MPANNRVTLVEKNIAFKIAQQFPAYFREYGSELVDIVEHYYRFVESQPNMGVYNTRKMFEYRDVGSTLSEMVIYFKNKYMADLPALDEQNTRVVIKNIMDLYRRKGTEAGIKLFFRMFYQEDVQLRYPSKYMFKPSDSKWQTGIFLQMYPNNNNFVSRSGAQYDYNDVLSKNILGSISKARAIIDKINFVYINGTLTPIIFLTDVKGKFIKYDDIIVRLNGEDVSFGKLNGSADSIEVDLTFGGTTGNNIGDIVNIISDYGSGGKATVSDLQDEFTGTIDYSLLKGGWGYTIDNTKLLVSNQVIVLDNSSFMFEELELLRDSGGNEGVVIGQNASSVGIKMNDGEFFDITRNISTVDRITNFTLTPYDAGSGNGEIFSIAPKNESSPGPLYANTGDPTHVKVEQLENIQNIGLITDIIGDFLNVRLDSSNYNTQPPALKAMSGTANPVTLATSLDQAFDLTPFEIGTIVSFENINPGQDYINDTFALVIDEQMLAFDRYEQILLVNNYSAQFSVGDEIVQPLTGTTGVITKIDNDLEALYVTPFSYYGFKTGTNDFFTHKGNNYDIASIERDYSSKRHGENAVMKTETLFSTGRIAGATIRNSGFGYVDKETVFLTDDDGNVLARAIIRANSQGITAGFWASQNSHVNGYWNNPESHEFEYYESKMKVQDSDYYQEYSYEIRSTVFPAMYEKVIKDTMHLAGTKMFSNFIYEKQVGPTVTAKMAFIKKDDYVRGGAEIVGPNQDVGDQTIRADNFVWTVDTDGIKADNG